MSKWADVLQRKATELQARPPSSAAAVTPVQAPVPPVAPAVAEVALACGFCHGPLDAKHRCWRCCWRACKACKRPTGSAYLRYCQSCDLVLKLHETDPE